MPEGAEARSSGRGVWLALGFAGLILLATAGLAASLGEGVIAFRSGARVEMTMPPAPEPAALEEAPGDTGPAPHIPAPVEPGLLEPSAFGNLPVRGEDGRRPLVAYAHPFDFDDPRPRVAVVLTGLGLEADITRAAIDLPAAVSLAFSPYGSHVAADVDAARLAGHEALLALPMEPPDYPDSDPGPHTLLADAPPEENLRRLHFVLSRALGYVAVTGDGGRFAAEGDVLPVVEELAARGVGLVDLGEDDLERWASRAAVPYSRARLAVDADPSVLAIEFALARLENQALTTGRALGVAQAYPVTLERLAAWIETLDDKGLVLAPASAVIRERAGILPTAGVGGNG